MIRFVAALCFFLSRSCAEATILDPSPYNSICLMYKAKNPSHTACRGFDSAWMDLYNFTKVNKVKDQAVYYINHYRGLVARGKFQVFPAAVNMRAVEWDDELEASAALHAYRLLNDSSTLHDRVEDRFTSKFEVTGQNVAFKRHLNTQHGYYWHYAVRQWVIEAVSSDPSIVRAYAAGSTDNFTQLVWADTQYVGCYQAVTSPDSFAKHEGFFTVHVCNFAPAGNVGGKPAYQEGPPCAFCPAGTACNVPGGLCYVTNDPPKWPLEDDYSNNTWSSSPARVRIDICILLQTSIAALLRA